MNILNITKLASFGIVIFISACVSIPPGNNQQSTVKDPGMIEGIKQKLSLVLEGTLTECAAKADQACIEKRLSEGTPIDQPDETGATALMLAAARSQDSISIFLLSKGAKAAQTNKRNQTPLHFSANSNSGSLVAAFAKAGANTNALDDAGQTPMMYAAARDSKDAAEILFKYGAKLDIKDKAGKSAEDIANNSGKRDMALLIRANFNKARYEKIRDQALKEERLVREKEEKIKVAQAAKEKRELAEKRKAAGICADPEFEYVKSRCGVMTTDNFRCIMNEKGIYANKCNKNPVQKQKFKSRSECLQGLGTDGAVRCFTEFPEKKVPLKYRNRSECLQALGTDGAVRCFQEFPG